MKNNAIVIIIIIIIIFGIRNSIEIVLWIVTYYQYRDNSLS